MTKLKFILSAAVVFTFVTNATPVLAHGKHSFKTLEEQLEHAMKHNPENAPEISLDPDDIEDDPEETQRLLEELRNMRGPDGRPLPNTDIRLNDFDDESDIDLEKMRRKRRGD